MEAVTVTPSIKVSKELKNYHERFYVALLDNGDIRNEDEEEITKYLFLVYQRKKYLDNYKYTYFSDNLNIVYDKIDNELLNLYDKVIVSDTIPWLHKLYVNYKQRLLRYRKLVYNLFSSYKYCYFLTFTLNDDNVDFDYYFYRFYFKVFLSDYVAVINFDFGSLNDRLHFHGLVFSNNCQKKDLDYFKNYSLGFYVCDSVIDDIKQVSKYINKLSLHSVKTGKVLRNIYINCNLKEVNND